jgi:hypothetical protein
MIEICLNFTHNDKIQRVLYRKRLRNHQTCHLPQIQQNLVFMNTDSAVKTSFGLKSRHIRQSINTGTVHILCDERPEHLGGGFFGRQVMSSQVLHNE